MPDKLFDARTLISGSIRRKLLILLLLVGIIPGMLTVFVLWRTLSQTLRVSVGTSFQQDAKEIAHCVDWELDRQLHEADELAGMPLVVSAVEQANSVYSDLTKEQAEEKVGTHSTALFSETERQDPLGRDTADFDDVRRYLRKYRGTTTHHAYDNFMVTDSRGAVIAAMGKRVPFYVGDAAWWKAALNAGTRRAFIGGARFDKKLGPLVTLAVPILDPSRATVVGVFKADLRVRDLLMGLYMTRKGATDDSAFSLIDSSGRDFLRGKQQPVLSDIRLDRLADEGSTWSGALNAAGREVIIGVAPIGINKLPAGLGRRIGWHALVYRRLDKVYMPLYQVVDRLVLLGALSIVIIFLIGWNRINKIAAPIKELSRAARAIGGGDLDQRVDLRTNDEIQYLAEEYNRMAAALKDSHRGLRRTNRELERASRHKSDFLANMSHELRTPLNSIIGFSDILNDRLFGPLTEKQQKYLSNIRSSGEHLLELINDILDLSKIEAGKIDLNYQEFSVGRLIEDSQAIVKPLADKKNLGLAISVGDLPPIRADEARCRQIMYNLLSNAIKFTESGGSITISAGKCEDGVEISVRDTGIGISQENQQEIFEKFRQVEGGDIRHFEGTGLGLALTKELVEMHGGTIWLESDFGRGSTFTFSLPVAPPAEASVFQQEPADAHGAVRAAAEVDMAALSE